MAFGIDDAIGAGSKLLDDAINKIWPDPQAKASAEATTMIAAAQASVEVLRQQMSLALAEASSGDKWTSRARPSFLYVMYVLILWGLPMSFLFAFRPDIGHQVADGFGQWLQAIPDAFWNTFAVSFSAYAVARSADKAGGIMPFLTGKKK